MIFGSVCSGIEGASVAWEPLGWTPSFFAEIADFPSRVLAHHYPHVPNLGDFTRRAKGVSDAARYKALGNSFAVPVVRWIGSRIDKIDSQYL